MFTDLLLALSSPTPRNLVEIASELGTTPERLRIALEHCERMGYLDRDDDACSASACASCPVACGMIVARPDGRSALPLAATWWRLTARGRRAVDLGRSRA